MRTAPKNTSVGQGPVQCRERLGGVLDFYYRAAVASSDEFSQRTTVYLRAAIPFTTVHTYSTKGPSEETANRSTSPWAG